jgi:hypothetical protein
MSENKISQSNDDNISLVDLFVVLLKYRRLILTVTLLGIIAAGAYYVLQRGKGSPAAQVPEEAQAPGEYEGRMMVGVNPRLGKSGIDEIPYWFSSRDILDASLKEAGVSGKAEDLLVVTYNRNDEAEIYFKSGFDEKKKIERRQIEDTFSVLLKNVETFAAGYYRRYAEDLVSYFEAAPSGGGRSGADYVRYRWAKDFLAGNDVVFVLLHPPFVSEVTVSAPTPAPASGYGAPLAISAVIVFASLLLAVFMAFLLNALRNMGADSEVMSKIRGALGKKPEE